MDFIVKQINTTTNKIPCFIEDKVYNISATFLLHFIGGSSILGSIFIVSVVILQKKSTFHCPQMHPTISIIITTLAFPVTLILGIFLVIYKTTVYDILRLKHGDKFRGLLNGPDTLWALDPSNSNSIINVLLIIRDKSGGMCRENVLRKLGKLTLEQSMWKLRCRIQRSMGYVYFLQKTKQNNDNGGYFNCMQLCKEFYANRNILQRTLSIFSTLQIEEGNLWEVYIGNETIIWGNKQDCYPLIVRFHHCIGDELVLLQLLQKCFSEEEDEEYNSGLQDDDDFVQIMIKLTIRTMHMVLVLSRFPQILLGIFRDVDKIEIQTPKIEKFTGEKVIAWKVENGYKYVNRVKKITKRFRGIGFLEVVISGISFSLNKFFKQKYHNIDALIFGLPQEENFINFQKSKIFSLKNRFSMGIFKLPLKLYQKNKNQDEFNWRQKFSQRCAHTTANLFTLRKSYEFQLNYYFIHGIIPLIPYWLLSCLNIQSKGVVITNLPGPGRIWTDKDKETSFVEDIVFWSPCRGFTDQGMSISIMSYEGRFQLGIAIDKSYKVTAQQAETILESFFEYIDNFYEELGEII